MQEPDLKRCNKLNVNKSETGHTTITYVDYDGNALGEDILDDNGDTVSSGKFPNAPEATDIQVNKAYRWFLQWVGTHNCPQCQGSVHDPGAINNLAQEDIVKYFDASEKDGTNPNIWCCGCTGRREKMEKFMTTQPEGLEFDVWNYACMALRKGIKKEVGPAQTWAKDYILFLENCHKDQQERKLEIELCIEEGMDINYLEFKPQGLRNERDEFIKMNLWTEMEPLFLNYARADLIARNVNFKNMKPWEIMQDCQKNRVNMDRKLRLLYDKCNDIEDTLDTIHENIGEIPTSHRSFDYSQIETIIKRHMPIDPNIQIPYNDQQMIWDNVSYQVYNGDRNMIAWTPYEMYINGEEKSENYIRKGCEQLVSRGYLVICSPNNGLVTYAKAETGGRP